MDSDKVYTVADSDSEGDKEEDDANLPSREECETRCQTFAEVTGTDSALAMFYLQDRDWDLQVSLYYNFNLVLISCNFSTRRKNWYFSSNRKAQF